MTLWPHQRRGLDEIQQHRDAGHRNICIASPTGGGKTRIMTELLTEDPGEISLYTDRRMLLNQTDQALWDAGIDHGIRAAGLEPALLRRVQLAMLQTEGSRCLNGSATRDVHPSDLLLIDEAHKMAAGTMAALDAKHLEARPDRVKLGFTATPLGIGHFYDHLVIAGTNSELRKCGALVPAYTFGPDEPDTKWVGKIVVGEGECGLAVGKRMEYAHRVFGRVAEKFLELNPEQKPSLLFAPGVAESKWFAQELTRQGIIADHIDGSEIWIEGQTLDASDENRALLAERSRDGRAKILCNRFVMREGINWPWIAHGIFATVFGSLTSYIQAGGRLLRADPDNPNMDRITCQDHGGNWHRHGSLNADRDWQLEYTDRIMAGLREKRIREKKEAEPIVCPKCYGLRTHGKSCPHCGYEHKGKVRMVLQQDGSLKPMRGDIYRPHRLLTPTQKVEQEWSSRIKAIRRSKKDTVANMTFSQARASFARDHNWGFPPNDLPQMPIRDIDWFLPVREVPEERLTQ
jgi:superfamily II DNA or RNA helicase